MTKWGVGVEPCIVQKPEIRITGFVKSGEDVRQIRIGELWDRFERHSSQICNKKPGIGYEVHIELSEPKRHYCMVGVEVSAVTEIPAGMSVGVLPAGKYAVFTHRLADGGLVEVYEAMEKWLKDSGHIEARPLEIQCFDSRFRGPNDPESVLEYHIPIKEK